MRITVLMGGTSAERDVSLASGLRIAEALRQRGHDVVTLDTARGTLSAKDEKALTAKGNVVKTEPPSREELALMSADTLPQMLRALPSLKEADVVFMALHGGHQEAQKSTSTGSLAWRTSFFQLNSCSSIVPTPGLPGFTVVILRLSLTAGVQPRSPDVPVK